MRDHQARLDKAESKSAELSVRNMADPSPTNLQLASDARVARNVILQEYDMSKHELSLIPGALKKLKRDIERLQGHKRIQEKASIISEITDIEEHRAAAIEALAKYAAYVCLTGNRNVQYVDAKEIGIRLDNQRELSNRYTQIYQELEGRYGV